MRKIDYNSPTHKMDEVMFNVELQDIYSSSGKPGTLFYKKSTTPSYKAVVNQQNGKILSVVGKNYKLITNERALDMGKEIFHSLYPKVQGSDLIPYKVVAPLSCASAHIDLIHQEVNFNVWEQETWLPFLRVTNSYNRTYALSFEIGFVRELCSNGVIFNKDTMKLKYVHNSNRIYNYNKDANYIEAKTLLFKNQCNKLHGLEIPPEHLFPMICKILNVKLELSNEKNAKRRIDSLYKIFETYQTLQSQYTKEFGYSAYSAFNIATDLISHQELYKNLTGYYLGVRSFYSRPSDWMEDFIVRAIERNESTKSYLKGVLNGLDEISRLTGFKWYVN